MGKAEVQAENYLFAKAIAGDKRAAFVICFDKKDQFMAAMPLLTSGSISCHAANRQYGQPLYALPKQYDPQKC